MAFQSLISSQVAVKALLNIILADKFDKVLFLRLQATHSLDYKMLTRLPRNNLLSVKPLPNELEIRIFLFEHN